MTLDELHALDTIARDEIPAAIALLAARWSMEPQKQTPPVAVIEEADSGAMLTAREAAARLGVSVRWVYRHARRLGGVRLSARTLRIPEVGVERHRRAKAREASRGVPQELAHWP